MAKDGGAENSFVEGMSANVLKVIISRGTKDGSNM